MVITRIFKMVNCHPCLNRELDLSKHGYVRTLSTVKCGTDQIVLINTSIDPIHQGQVNGWEPWVEILDENGLLDCSYENLQVYVDTNWTDITKGGKRK